MSDPAEVDTTLPDTTAGLPFRFAMRWYGNDESVAAYRKLVLRHPIKRGTPGALNEADLGAMNSRQLVLVEDQLRRLRSGIQRAMAFRPSSLVLEDIPKEWWGQVRVNVERNTAESNGIILSSILIYPGKQHTSDADLSHPAAPDPIRSQSPKVSGGPLVERKFAAWVEELGRDNLPSRRQADVWAKENNCSTGVVRDLHKDIAARGAGRPRTKAQK